MTIIQGKIGYVFARDEPAQVLASKVTVHDFQDVTTFLKNGGQKGLQRLILREGTHAFNLMQFVVITEERVFSLPVVRFIFPFLRLSGFTVFFLAELYAFLFEAWYVKRNVECMTMPVPRY